MSLYSAGRVTGVSIESGEGLTHSVPIYEGFVVKNDVVGAENIEISGSSMNAYLKRLLQERCTNKITQDVVQDIKEKLCFVAMKFNDEYAPK